ncbi:MAG: hypothetical protein EBU88_20025, partial [Acidobacteria bacterium]|nr:hypothetical protein [Acidobacteriota bacterium]
ESEWVSAFIGIRRSRPNYCQAPNELGFFDVSFSSEVTPDPFNDLFIAGQSKVTYNAQRIVEDMSRTSSPNIFGQGSQFSHECLVNRLGTIQPFQNVLCG